MSITTPDYVQKYYDRVLSDGLPGSNVDANPTYDYSFIAENSDIGFGLVVSLGSSYGPPVRARLGSTGAHAATAGTATGTGNPVTYLPTYVAITSGQFQLRIDGIARKLESMDFSSVTSMADVAAVIQAKIRAYTGGGTPYTSATCTFTAGQFVITSGTTGAASIVSAVDHDQTGTGTDVLITLGLDSVSYVNGLAVVASATILGVTLRSLTEEGGAGSALSNTTTVKQGHIGAFRQDGKVKVLCTDDCTAGAQVYFVAATGAIQGASSGGTALGTAKFAGNFAAGTVGVINLTGLR